MIKYCLKSNCKRPTKPQKDIVNGNELLSMKELYVLDREYVLKKEKYDKREMIAYDKSIELEISKTLKTKTLLIRELEKEIINKYNNQSISIILNDYNGYKLIVGDIIIETYNYLKIDLISICLNINLIKNNY